MCRTASGSSTHIPCSIQPNTLRKFALYGGRQTVTLIPGDGIGPEVTDAVKKVFLCAGVVPNVVRLRMS